MSVISHSITDNASDLPEQVHIKSELVKMLYQQSYTAMLPMI